MKRLNCFEYTLPDMRHGLMIDEEFDHLIQKLNILQTQIDTLQNKVLKYEPKESKNTKTGNKKNVRKSPKRKVY